MPSKKANKKKELQEQRNRKIVMAFVMLAILCVSVIALCRWGFVGHLLNNVFSFLFGDFFALVLFSVLFVIFYKTFLFNKYPLADAFFAGLILFNIGFILLSGLLKPANGQLSSVLVYAKNGFLHLLDQGTYSFGAGLLATFLFLFNMMLFDKAGTVLITVLVLICAVILMIPFKVYRSAFESLKRSFSDHREEKKKAKAIKEEALMASKESFAEKHFMVSNTGKAKHKSSLFIDVEEPRNEEDITEDSLSDILTHTPEKETVETLFPNAQKEEKGASVSCKEPSNVSLNPLSNKKYVLPPLSLLETPVVKKTNVNLTSAQVKGQKIVEICNSFGIPTVLINTHVGPSVTKFEIKPDSSVKVNRIMAIQDNIKMELAAKDIRIEAPIPGRNAVGIEIPNVEPVAVYMSEILSQVPDKKKESPLLFALGKDLLGKAVFCELDRMPHLLIAGATGSGKSVCINTIIMSLIMRNRPEDVKLVLVDPKKVEFSPYHDVPHLLWPVITDVSLASNLLQRVVGIMEERYDAFANVGVRNITSFNEFVLQHNQNRKEDESPMQTMPYIVVIIDELADMMALAKKDVELSIQRITQLARACGIHLIVATQRPSTDVITGIIKANIPSRISFAVSSGIDSRTILDTVGAERLLGHGDMLYFPTGESSPIRLQGVYVRDNEIRRVTDFLKKEAKPAYDDAYYELLNLSRMPEGETGVVAREEDALMAEVKEYVRESQKASTSLLQRRFGIGYNRAARLIDAMEQAGYIGPVNGSKPREVYLKKQEDE